MFSKKNRLNSREVEELFRSGKTISSRLFLLKFSISGTENHQKSAFSVPKKLIKSAFQRNSLKRKGFSALRTIKEYIPLGFYGVFVFRRKNATFSEIKQELEGILRKI